MARQEPIQRGSHGSKKETWLFCNLIATSASISVCMEQSAVNTRTQLSDHGLLVPIAYMRASRKKYRSGQKLHQIPPNYPIWTMQSSAGLKTTQ